MKSALLVAILPVAGFGMIPRTRLRAGAGPGDFNLLGRMLPKQ